MVWISAFFAGALFPVGVIWQVAGVVASFTHLQGSLAPGSYVLALAPMYQYSLHVARARKVNSKTFGQ